MSRYTTLPSPSNVSHVPSSRYLRAKTIEQVREDVEQVADKIDVYGVLETNGCGPLP